MKAPVVSVDVLGRLGFVTRRRPQGTWLRDRGVGHVDLVGDVVGLEMLHASLVGLGMERLFVSCHEISTSRQRWSITLAHQQGRRGANNYFRE